MCERDVRLVDGKYVNLDPPDSLPTKVMRANETTTEYRFAYFLPS